MSHKKISSPSTSTHMLVHTVGTLSVTATPIGNLRDWTYRAEQTAREADIILCEDTRVTRKLLSHFGINTPTMSYHEHNALKQHPAIITMLMEGKHVMLVSDAGTPLISDPGSLLVQEAVKIGAQITPIPGASSVIAALSVAGLSTQRFMFLGFLPTKHTARCKEITRFSTLPATLVFLESPNRIVETLRDLHIILGTRQAVMLREITKLYEETVRGSLQEILIILEARSDIKGEIVLVVDGAQEQDLEVGSDDADIENLLLGAMQHTSLKDAVKAIADATGLQRKTLYDMALQLRMRQNIK